MKRAPLVAFAAIALYLVGLGSTGRQVMAKDAVLALDITGIQTVQVRASHTSIKLKPGARASVSYDDSRIEVKAARSGSLLLVVAEVKAEGRGDARVELVLPTTLRSLVTDESDVELLGPALPSFEYQGSGDLAWAGDVVDLSIVDRQAPGLCRGDWCTPDLTVAGHIGRLTIRAERADVTLKKPDHVGSASFLFGPRSTLSFGQAQRLGDWQLLGLDGGSFVPAPRNPSTPDEDDETAEAARVVRMEDD
jgi:hypothetical protein